MKVMWVIVFMNRLKKDANFFKIFFCNSSIFTVNFQNVISIYMLREKRWAYISLLDNLRHS